MIAPSPAAHGSLIEQLTLLSVPLLHHGLGHDLPHCNAASVRDRPSSSNANARRRRATAADFVLAESWRNEDDECARLVIVIALPMTALKAANRSHK